MGQLFHDAVGYILSSPIQLIFGQNMLNTVLIP